jgi:opacity protein-like surface antigen
MKIKLIALAFFASQLATASTPIDGWYSSALGGFAYLPSNVNTYIPNGLFIDGTNYHIGYDVGGRIGYKYNPLRFEAEVTYINSGLDNVSINTIPQMDFRGESSGTFLMGNVYYDFPDMLPGISPFIGLGLGYGYLSSFFESNDLFTTINYNPSDSVFAYQGSAGLTYNFAENYAVSANYRYIRSTNAGSFGEPFQAHLAEFGVTYRFNISNYQ